MVSFKPEYSLALSDLENRKEKCWYPLGARPYNHRLCENRVKRDEVNQGALLHKIIHGYLADGALDHALMALLNHNCCKRAHREKGNDILKKQICDWWKDQLRARARNATNSAQGSQEGVKTSSTVLVTQYGTSNRPFTRSQANKDKTFGDTQIPARKPGDGFYVEAFTRKNPRPTLMSDRLNRPLVGICLQSGRVYAYTASASGIHKLGWTRVSASSRESETNRLCGVATQPLYETEVVSHPYLIEQLSIIELEMAGYRKRVICRCSAKHGEWFSASGQEVTRVIRSWTDWMVRARPYDANNELKPIWRKVIHGMARAGQEITGQALVDMIPPSSIPGTVGDIHEHSLEEGANTVRVDDFGDTSTLLEPAAEDSLPKAAEPSTGDDSFTLVDTADIKSGGERTSSTVPKPVIVTGPESTTTSPTLDAQWEDLQSARVLSEIMAQQQLTVLQFEILAKLRQRLTASLLQWATEPQSPALSERLRLRPLSSSTSTFPPPPPRVSVPVAIPHVGTVAA